MSNVTGSFASRYIESGYLEMFLFSGVNIGFIISQLLGAIDLGKVYN